MEKMEESICLDTDFLVDLLRNKSDAVAWLSENIEKSTIYTTLINIFELYYGAYKSINPEKKIGDVEKLIERIDILNLSTNSVKEAANQLSKLEEKGNVIDIKDLLIGTFALTNGFALKTNNKKYFERIENLKII